MTVKTFRDLGLSDTLLAALEAKGFSEPTPIQAAAIPEILSGGQDLIGQAQTGTGKTAAFGLPLIDLLPVETSHVQALIVTPTRELTIQVCDELNSLKGKKRLTITPIYGGQSIQKQKKQLAGQINIIVGTPGRLMDHMKNKALNLSQLDYVILDEADEMLKFGFLEDIKWILSHSNPERTSILFSATMPDSILKLAQKHMRDPIQIKAKPDRSQVSLTEQLYIVTRDADKLQVLYRIMDAAAVFYGIVFCRTKRDVDAITERLIGRGYNAEAMHGDLNQFQRERVLQKFKQKQCTILVVTDVAARGIDVTGVTHVINYSIPQDAEAYVHRVGRTGRAGQSGIAISLVAPSEQRKLRHIEKVASMSLKKIEPPSVKDIVMNKKERIKASVQALREKELMAGFSELADELLDLYSPEEALVRVLQASFSAQFSNDHYKDIKPATLSKPKKDKSSKFRRRGPDSRGRHESFKGRKKGGKGGKGRRRTD